MKTNFLLTFHMGVLLSIGFTTILPATASDFQSAMPDAFRTNSQLPRVNVPNTNAQTLTQPTPSVDAPPPSATPAESLRGFVGNRSPINPNPAAQEPLTASPVSAFFKVSDQSTKQPLVTTPPKADSERGVPTVATEQSHGSSKEPSVGKLFWHVLDNMGVPMFGSTDTGLAPGLEAPQGMPNKAYFLSHKSDSSIDTPSAKVTRARIKQSIPPPVTSGARISPEGDQPSSVNASEQQTKSPAEKIPQIELEGVAPTEPSNNDVPKNKP